jgi:myo-inositol-1(or 4)-monophosphatase
VISAALARKGRPRLGAIFAPVTDEFFLAEEGEGVTRNGTPINVSDGTGFEGAKLLGPKRFVGTLSDLHPGIVPLPRIGSLALRLARVAHGGADFTFVSGNSHDWDLAAADLLVHEAGGLLTDLDGERLLYNRPEPKHGPLVASGRSRHAMMLELLRNRRAQLA